MDIDDFAESITTKKEFIRFLELLRKDFDEKGTDWENPTLENFLEALEAYCKDTNENQPSWKYFADLLLGATIYE